MIAVSDLPAVNAALNATAAILIGAGVYFIKRKNIPAHKACMVAALAVSTLFLTSHTILAALILPMILRTAFLAFRGRFRNHVRIAKWTFPAWIYVSVTGVVVYLMLYR